MDSEEKTFFWMGVRQGVLDGAFFMACMSVAVYHLLQIIRMFE